MNKLLFRLLIEYTDTLGVEKEFTIRDFQDYVFSRSPRNVPTTAEVSRMIVICDNIMASDNHTRWTTYKVVA